MILLSTSHVVLFSENIGICVGSRCTVEKLLDLFSYCVNWSDVNIKEVNIKCLETRKMFLE